MGPWLVLVSPCFRENVVATCKIGSFLCSLHNLLQKNVIVLFFRNQISKWRSFEKNVIFDLLSPPSPSGVTKADYAGSSGGRGDSDEVVTNIEQDQYAPRKNRVRNENESTHRQLVYGQRKNIM